LELSSSNPFLITQLLMLRPDSELLDGSTETWRTLFVSVTSKTVMNIA